MRWSFRLAILALVLLCPSASLAQGDAVLLPESQISGSATGIMPELLDVVANLDAAIVSGDKGAASARMATLLEWKARLSARNLFFVSRMLRARAGMLAHTGNSGGAAQSATYACRVSPDDSDSWFAAAYYSYINDSADFKGWLSPAHNGIRTWFLDPLNQEALPRHALSTAVYGLAFAFMIFSLTALIIYLKPMARDMQRMLPIEINENTSAIAVVLFFLSVLLGMGFVAAFATLALFLAGYVKTKGRIVLAFFVALFAAIPFVIPVISEGMALESSHQARSISHFIDEGWEPGEIQPVEELSARYPDDLALMVMAGSYYRKMGDYEHAQKYLQQALAKNNRNLRAIVEMGNVNFGRGEFREAELMYKNAIGLSPALFEGHFNLSNTYIEEFRPEEAEAEMSAATRLNKKKADFLLSAKSDKNPVKVVSVPPARSMPASVYRAVAHDAGHVGREMRIFFMPFMDAEQYQIATIAYAVLFVLSILIWEKAGAHTLCTTCGETFYPMFMKAEKGGIKCDKCVALASAQKSAIIGSKDKIRIGIRGYQSGLRHTANLLNMVAPGVGSIWYGSYISGGILVCITGIFFGQVFSSVFWIAAGYRPEPVATYVVWGIGMILFYALTMPFTTRRKR